jgi:3-oxoadipate enol-lactonase
MDQPEGVRFLEIAGARLAHQEVGTGTPVVLSHAALGDRRMWGPQLSPLAERYRVIRYDARGFGLTTSEGGPFDRSEDLRTLLDALDVERAHLVGASLGGRVSIDFALAHPDRVLSLILVGSVVQGFEFTDPRVLASWEEEEAAWEAHDEERLVANEMRTWLAGRGRDLQEVDADVRDLVRDMLLDSYRLPEPGEERRPEPAAVGRLGEISAPTLVLVGDRDAEDVIRIADLLAAEIPGAIKRVIADAAHAPSLERPEEFNRLVLDFLARV